MTIRYAVAPSRPDAHEYTVRMSVPDPDPAGQVVRFATWIPGSYMIRDFSKSIVSIRARGRRAGLAYDSEGAAPVALVKLDKAGWRAPADLTALELELVVHAHEASVRAAWLDRHRAFFNGTSLFPYLPGREHEAVEIRLERPTHAAGAAWRVATTLPAVDVDGAGFGEYRASGYDEAIDHPVEMGELESLEFDACGVPHEMVFANRAQPFDRERVAEDLRRVCEWQIRFFGEPAPMPRYLFQVALSESGYGGLEHRASTALVAARGALPMPRRDADAGGADGDAAEPKRDDAYVTFLGLCSHEYFHTWNVKRITPARFRPYRLDGEVHTRLLWFFEGVTSYYDDLALVRAGLIARTRYLELLARTVSRVRRGPGHRVQSVTDSSFDAWTKFYTQDENAPNAIVSYYAKGALVALCLDAWMREASGDEVSLDTLMRALWARWKDGGDGLDEDGPERLVAELVGDTVAERLADVLDATEELPLEPALRSLGIALSWRLRIGTADDAGPVKEDAEPAPWFGATLRDGPAGTTLVHVLADGPAQRAGLAPGDVLVALEGYRVDTGSLDTLLRRHAGLDAVEVHAFRNGVLFDTSVSIELSPPDTAVMSVVDEARADTWLGASA